MEGNHFWLDAPREDLQAPIEARRFGSDWFAGFFALVLAIAGFGFVLALRWPGLLALRALAKLRDLPGFRFGVHFVPLASYALALHSLLLRPAKAIGFTALTVGIAAALLGGGRSAGRVAHLGCVRARLLHRQPRDHWLDVRSHRTRVAVPEQAQTLYRAQFAYPFHRGKLTHTD